MPESVPGYCNMKISLFKALGLHKKKQKPKRIGGFRKKLKSRFDPSDVGSTLNQKFGFHFEPESIEISSGGFEYNDEGGESYTDWSYVIGLADGDVYRAYVDFTVLAGTAPNGAKAHGLNLHEYADEDIEDDENEDNEKNEKDEDD